MARPPTTPAAAAFARAMRPRNSRTELAHKLMWYVEHYGLALNTVRRHRAQLDDPRNLFLTLLNARGPAPVDLRQLYRYIKHNEK